MADNTSLEEQLELAVAEFLLAEEAGRPIPRGELLAKYPTIERDLNDFCDAHERLRSAAAPLRQSVEYLVQRWDHTPNLIDQATLDFSRSPHVEDGPRALSFGDYELLDELGRGGMGVVYKARHVRLNRVVALKMVLAGRFADESDLARFRAEALTAAKLEHSGIVPIHEAGEVDGVPYFSMSYVEGISLADEARKGPLLAAEAARMVRKIAAAVAYAHAQGVIHRDLKPANILLARDPDTGRAEPKITDFGLARRMDVDSRITTTGQVLGTPSYMSPEQASGRPHDADAAADIYSLGAILYTVLTGRPPFVADSPMDVLLQVLERDPPTLQSINPTVPRELEWICLKCLEKRPSDRYASAAELADDLDRFLRQEPPEARAGPIGHRLRRWGRREPVFAAHFLGLAFILTLIQFVFIGHAERDWRYHLPICGLLLAWMLASWALQQLTRREQGTQVALVWNVADVGFLTGLLYLLVAPLGLLFSSYHVLIGAASLYFRTRLVVLTTILSMIASACLLLIRGETGPWHYALFFEATLALTGFFVSYHVWRLGILREYYEERRPGS